jgi:hypothetical protein
MFPSESPLAIRGLLWMAQPLSGRACASSLFQCLIDPVRRHYPFKTLLLPASSQRFGAQPRQTHSIELFESSKSMFFIRHVNSDRINDKTVH